MKASNEGIVMKAPPPHAAERFFKGEKILGAPLPSAAERLFRKETILGAMSMNPGRLAG